VPAGHGPIPMPMVDHVPNPNRIPIQNHIPILHPDPLPLRRTIKTEDGVITTRREGGGQGGQKSHPER